MEGLATCGHKHYNFGLLVGQLFYFNLVHLILQVRAARGLLSAVTRLLILADIIDVNLMLKKLQQVENDLENLKNANSQAELMDSMGRFTHSAQELMAQAAKRSVKSIPILPCPPASATPDSSKKRRFCFLISALASKKWLKINNCSPLI